MSGLEQFGNETASNNDRAIFFEKWFFDNFFFSTSS